MKHSKTSTRLRLHRLFWIVAVSILVSSASLAKPPEPEFMRQLYLPELVMQNHRAIDLSREQRKTITKAIQATQAATVELGWSMQDAALELKQQMSAAKINEAAALEAAERMMAVEGQVKRAHLGLLIQIKNALSKEQQRKLDTIRAKDTQGD